MKAIILAAGRGSRMGFETESKPKCLIEINGKSLLSSQIEALLGAGIKEIGIVTGYKSETLPIQDLTRFHNGKWYETNMVTSLEQASEWLLEEPCIVSYSDILYGKRPITSLIDSNYDISITYDPHWKSQWQRRFVDILSDAETFRFSEQGFLEEIGGQATKEEHIQGQYMGLLKFTPRGWKQIQKLRTKLPINLRNKMDMTSTLQKIIETKKLPIKVIPNYESWAEFDSLSDLRSYED